MWQRQVREVSPNQIIADFGGKAEPTRRGIQALVDAIESGVRSTGSSRNSDRESPLEGGTASAAESLESWKLLFRKTCGQDWPRPKARLDRLARHYGVAYDPSRSEIVLFALQTWYVLLVKLLAGHVVAAVRGRPSPAAEAAKDDARAVIGPLMQGGVFAALAATDPWPGEPFGWCTRAWSESLEQATAEAARRIAGYDPSETAACAATGRDLLKPLYESLFPRTVRHALGEYYTPDWLAKHVLDQVGYFGQRDVRLLDPTCGSGTFLLAALRRWRQRVGWDKGAQRAPAHHEAPAMLDLGGPALASSLVPPYELIAGFDLHPLAVAAARANYLLAIADLLPAEGCVEVPVFARDAVLDPWPEPPGFDFVVGNPPWVAWDNLPGDYREASKPQWQRYGLFSLSGNAARHGGGKKDLSMLMLYSAADRYLRDGGRLGMVITQTLFQSKGAGDGFRRFRIGDDGPPLGVLHVDDLVDVRPFGDAANWTSVVVLQKGVPTAYPVRYVKWKAGKAGERLPSAIKIDMLAQPIDAGRPGSPWIVRTANSAADPRPQAGGADYTAHLGANSGGANAVYWLEVLERHEHGVRVRNRVVKAKRTVDCVDAVIEPDLLYPLVRWSDVRSLVRAALGLSALGPGPGDANGHRRGTHAMRLPADVRLLEAIRAHVDRPRRLSALSTTAALLLDVQRRSLHAGGGEGDLAAHGPHNPGGSGRDNRRSAPRSSGGGSARNLRAHRL